MSKKLTQFVARCHAGEQGRRVVVALFTSIGCILLLLGISSFLHHSVGDRPDSVTLSVRSTTGSTSGNTAAASTGAASAASDRDAALRAKLLGTWRDFHHGQRTMTVRDDGTATMVCQFSGMKARLFTPRLQLEMTWSVENGRMLRRTTGGSPKSKVDFVNSYYGDRVSEPILDVSDTQLLLQDQDGSQRYRWRRVNRRSSD